MLRTLEIRHYGPVCDVSETGLYHEAELGYGNYSVRFLVFNEGQFFYNFILHDTKKQQLWSSIAV